MRGRVYVCSHELDATTHNASFKRPRQLYTMGEGPYPFPHGKSLPRLLNRHCASRQARVRTHTQGSCRHRPLFVFNQATTIVIVVTKSAGAEIALENYSRSRARVVARRTVRDNAHVRRGERRHRAPPRIKISMRPREICRRDVLAGYTHRLHTREGALWCSSHVFRPFLTKFPWEWHFRRDSRSALLLLLFLWKAAYRIAGPWEFGDICWDKIKCWEILISMLLPFWWKSYADADLPHEALKRESCCCCYLTTKSNDEHHNANMVQNGENTYSCILFQEMKCPAE
jgi:hypothetical protein